MVAGEPSIRAVNCECVVDIQNPSGFVEKLTNTATIQSAVRRDLSVGS